MRSYSRQTGEFTARDVAGNTYMIHEYTRFDEFVTEEGTRTMEGPKSLCTSDGDHIKRIAKGRYIVSVSNIELTSDDPKAP